jgi:beta-lactamase class A
LVVTKLRDQKPSVDGTESSANKEEDRREWALRGLSLSLACLVAGFAFLFVWGTEEEQGAIETVLGASVEEESLSSPEAPEGFDPAALRDRLEEIAAGHEGVYGVAVLESASETQISLRGDEQLMVASIGKLPVLATLYRAGTQGELDLQEEIPVLPEDIRDYGDGDIPDFPAEDFLNLRDGAYRMINHSDNVAWSMLDRRLGAEKIRSALEGMGIRSSWYSDDLSGYFTTPNDVLLLLEKISDPRFTSEEFSAEMLNVMTETHLEDRIPEKLPLEVRVAHKTGTYEDNFGDAGVVFYEDSWGVVKHYYLVVLAKGTGEDEARDAIQSISLTVYEALTGNKIDPGWSRGELYSSVREEETLDQEGTTEPYLP